MTGRHRCEHPDCPRTIGTYSRWCGWHNPKAVAFRATPDDPRHGTWNGRNNLRCDCTRCLAANKQRPSRAMPEALRTPPTKPTRPAQRPAVADPTPTAGGFRYGGTITLTEYKALTANLNRPLTLPVGRDALTIPQGQRVA
jgi:hypothetical protein